MRTPLVAAAWVATIAGAFVAGRALAPERPPEREHASAGDAIKLSQQVDDLERTIAKLEAKRAHRDGGRVRAGEETPSADAAPTQAAPASASSVAADVAAPAAFSLEGVTDAADASKKFMAFVEAQLKRGDTGFAAILQALDSLWKDQEKMKVLFADEGAASRLLYPWIKLLVQHDAQMTDLTEYVFRTMAENPSAFANTADSKELELFTEGLGFLMPGAVSEERLARLRGYAEKFLATPESDQPKALRGNRSEVERLLARFWSSPITPEQALEKLKAGDVPPRDLVKYLRMVPPEAAAMLDVTALVVPHVRQGSYDAMRWLGSPPLDHLDYSRLDPAVLEGVDAGKTNWSQLATYARIPGRKQWSEVRPLFDRALAGSERCVSTALQVLASGILPSNLRPDKAYVESLLTRPDVPETMQNQLKAMYEVGVKGH